MPLYGYARVSTLDQDFAIQHTALKAVGCEMIRSEKASGARRGGHSKLQTLFDSLCGGNTLVIARINRLARSLEDPQDIVHDLKARVSAVSFMHCSWSCRTCWQWSAVWPAELSGIQTFYDMAFEQAK
jgi:DNA invertase Pin-like site-specific DNA recombinase